LTELARLPNSSCKISGMVTEADVQHWTAEDLKPYVRHVLESFGIDRVMFGSDAPVLYLAGTYERWVTTLQSLTADLSASDQQKLWHDNAARFYRL
jgi:L-fuconolactonase